jgi:chromosome segregation ATPase
MKNIFLIVIISLALQAPSHAQAPAAGSEAKLKEMVRSLTQRVTQAEQDTAKLQGEKTTLETKLKEQDEQIKKMTGVLKEKTEELTLQREQSTKLETNLKSELSEKSKQLKEYQTSLDKWKAAHAEITEVARKKEAERGKQAARASALERRVEDLRMRNGAMFKAGNEVLDRYAKFSLGEALLAREPFTGNMKIKLKNEFQETADALLDALPDSGRTPKNEKENNQPVNKKEKFLPPDEEKNKSEAPQNETKAEVSTPRN